MINSAKSARLLAQCGELLPKDSFDLPALKKRRFPDHVFSRWKWFSSPLCLMPGRALGAALKIHCFTLCIELVHIFLQAALAPQHGIKKKMLTLFSHYAPPQSSGSTL